MRVRDSISVNSEERNTSRGSYGERAYKHEYHYGYLHKNNCIEINHTIGRTTGFSSGSSDTYNNTRYFIWINNGKGWFTKTNEYNKEEMGLLTEVAIEFAMMGMVQCGLRFFKPINIPLDYAERCVEIIKQCLDMEVEREANNYFMERIKMLTGDKFRIDMDVRHKLRNSYQRQDKKKPFYTASMEKEYLESKMEERKARKTKPEKRPEKSRNIFSGILK